MNAVRRAQGVGADFRKAQRAHLALFDKIGHGPDAVFHRHRAIAAMHVVEINDIDAEPFQ